MCVNTKQVQIVKIDQHTLRYKATEGSPESVNNSFKAQKLSNFADFLLLQPLYRILKYFFSSKKLLL
jgi:hypothetical protein